MDICRGSLVYSLAGRDKGTIFAVIKIENGFAYIANGDTRRVSNPKRKKMKHLQKTNSVLELDFDNVSDNSLRKALLEFSAL